MSGASVLGKISSISSKQSLYAGAIATAFTVLIGDAESGTASIGAAALAVGAPTIIGGLVANTIVPVKALGDLQLMTDIKRGAVAGAAGVGFLMAIGQLPLQFDAQLLGTVALIGVSTLAGDVAQVLLGVANDF